MKICILIKSLPNSKALPHNYLGEVDIKAYRAWIKALMIGNSSNFESIPLGGVTKLVNPEAAYVYNLVGPDSHHLSMIVPTTFTNPWIAGEMAEVYWRVLIRDVPFIDYNTNQLINY